MQHERKIEKNIFLELALLFKMIHKFNFPTVCFRFNIFILF